MWNGPDGVVYRRYMNHQDRPQINYYNLFTGAIVYVGDQHKRPFWAENNPFVWFCTL